MYFHDGDTLQGCVATTFADWAAQTTDADLESTGLSEIRYRGSADGTIQPAMFFAPHVGRRVPLLVALHTWSGDYRQDLHGACAAWCQEKDWAYIHPNFRGPNRRPEATGSDLVVQDIVDAIAPESDRFTAAEIDFFVREAKVPPHLQQELVDPTYGDKRPLFRRRVGQARVTLFDGGHELIPQAALKWLEQQQQPTPPAGIGNPSLPAPRP